MSKTALIKISPETREMMKNMASKKQTYDDLIVELIAFKQQKEALK